MLGWLNREMVEEKAKLLADALRASYGSQASEICNAALTHPELSSERRRVIRLALRKLEHPAAGKTVQYPNKAQPA